MDWRLAAASNAIIALAYLSVAVTVFASLERTRQLRSNMLGLATGLIFTTCALGHAGHFFHLVEPGFGLGAGVGGAARAAVDWHTLIPDLAAAATGVWYWSLRSHYRRLLDGPGLFMDYRARQRQALEINDNIVQGLAVAKYALEAGDAATAERAVERTLAGARRIMSTLLDDGDIGTSVRGGDLVRTQPATVLSSGTGKE